MGLLKRDKKPVPVARAEENALERLISMLLDVGLDGAGPLPPAAELGHKAFLATHDREKAVARVGRRGLVKSGVSGFATSLGGFITMPVALPANVAAFYLQATRMVGAIAHLRGYNLNDPAVRTAVLLTLVGADATDILSKAGVKSPTGAVTGVAMKNLPPAALMMVNKAIGFRLIRGLSEKTAAQLGRAVPLAGGAIGATMDTVMMKTIASHAMKEFPVVVPPVGAPNAPGNVVPGNVIGGDLTPPAR